MATVFVTSNLTGADGLADHGSPAFTISDGDDVYIARNALVAGAFDGVDFDSLNLSLTIDGAVYGGSRAIVMTTLFDAPDLDFDYRVQIGANGSVSSGVYGIFLGVFSTVSATIDPDSTAAVINAGAIHVLNEDAVTIQSVATGVLTNTGTITSGIGSSIGNTVDMSNVTDASVINSGQIIGHNTGGSGLG